MTPAAPVYRDADAQRLDKMRRSLAQVPALEERLVDERNLAILEVAQSAVNQATRHGRATAAHIVLVEDDDFQAAQRCVACDAGTVDTCANDRNVKGLLVRQT